MRIVVMKLSFFGDEREWRVAYSQEDNAPLQVHPGNGKSYVELRLASDHPPHTHRLPITGVKLGKYAEMSEDSVRALLQGRGYNLAAGNVTRSDVEPNPNPAAD